MQVPDKKYRWYAIYTRNQHEKKVNKFLSEKNIVSYLPLQKKLRYWSDRKKWLEIPLFSCYVFVNVSNKEYFSVLEHPSIIRYVCFGGQAKTIPEEQINSIRAVISSKFDYVVSNSCYNSGQQIEINNGLLKGCCGEIIRRSGKSNLLIRIDNIGYSLLVNMSTKYIA